MSLLVGEYHPATREHYQDMHLDHGFRFEENQQNKSDLLDDHEGKDGLHYLLLVCFLEIEVIVDKNLDEESADSHNRQSSEFQVFIVVLGLLVKESVEVSFEHYAYPRKDLNY